MDIKKLFLPINVFSIFSNQENVNQNYNEGLSDHSENSYHYQENNRAPKDEEDEVS